MVWQSSITTGTLLSAGYNYQRAFFVCFIVLISTGTYTRRISVQGEVTTWPRPVNVYSGVQGFVATQFVREGDPVKKGDPVYQIDVSKSTRRGVVNETQRQDIENQLKRIAEIIARLRESKETTLRMLEQQKIQYSASFERSAGIVRRAEEGIKLMKNNMDNYRRYQQQGLINKDQLTSLVALYYQQHNSLLSLSAQHEQNALQLTNLESQIQTQAAEFDNRFIRWNCSVMSYRKSGLILMREAILSFVPHQTAKLIH